MNKRTGLLGWFLKADPFLTTGVVISIALAVILVLSGQDEVSSLMIGLTVTAITLLIDVIARLKNTEDHILQATTLGSLLLSDTELHQTIRQITQSYLSAQDSEFDLFIQRSKDALLECKEILDGLERGYIVVEPGGKYTYGRKGVNVAQENVKAIAYEDIESWRTEHLKGVIQANAEAVRRGVRIQRVFILDNDSLSQAEDVLQAHKDAGVEVFVVSPEALESTQLLESYLVVDNRILVVFYYTRDGRRFKGERVSIEPVEVGTAVARFDSVLNRAKAYK
jgi:hypothetical protein